MEHDLEGSWKEFEKIKEDGLAKRVLSAVIAIGFNVSTGV